MDFDWKEIGKQVAKLGLPLLGTALAGPAGGAIGAGLASAIGGDTKAEDIVQTLTSSADALQKAREFEATHREHLLELTTKHEMALAQAEEEDRKSARQAMVDTKSITPSALSWLVVSATCVIYGWLIAKGNPSELDDIILGRILGTLDMAFGVVLSFWLGTSFSSRQKDSTISKLSA